MNRIPELLSPAGDMARLRAAIRFGADAVYGGMKRFGLRASAGNFTPDELARACELAHGAGKKFYVTFNSFPFDSEMDDFVATAREALDCGVDAAIVSDLGAVMTLRREVPELTLHISTQANTLNTPAARFYADIGAKRIVLAREMTMDGIREMGRSLGGAIELEAFVHGAMCVSYSGRCLLSAETDGRSANRGACSQPCRLAYTLMRGKEEHPIEQDERGTYILSSYDMCMLPHLPELVQSGIASLKIEGRMKTEYYVATVTRAYRRALDLLVDDPAAFDRELPSLLEELDKSSHRPYCTGFYYGAPTPAAGAAGTSQTMEYAARCEGSDVFTIRCRIREGDEAELLTPAGVRKIVIPPMLNEETGETVSEARVPSMRVVLPLGAREGDILRVPDKNHRGGA